MSSVRESALASQEAAPSSQNEKTNAEREATPSDMMTRPATGIMTDKSTRHCLPSFLQGLIKAHSGLDFFQFLYAKMLLQLERPYSIVPCKQRLILERDYFANDRTCIYLSVKKWTVLSSPMTTSLCRWTYSSFAPFSWSREWMIDWKNPLAQQWNVRLTFKLIIKGQLTPTLTTEDHWPPIKLTILDHFFFQKLPLMLLPRSLSSWRQSAHSVHCDGLPDSI